MCVRDGEVKRRERRERERERETRARLLNFCSSLRAACPRARCGTSPGTVRRFAGGLVFAPAHGYDISSHTSLALLAILLLSLSIYLSRSRLGRAVRREGMVPCPGGVPVVAGGAGGRAGRAGPGRAGGAGAAGRRDADGGPGGPRGPVRMSAHAHAHARARAREGTHTHINAHTHTQKCTHT